MRVVVERSRGKSLLACVGAVLFVLASLALVAEGSALTFVVGVVGIAFFGFAAIAWVVLLLRRGPGLVVDDDGFDDRSSAMSVGRVPWTDVTSIGHWGAFGTWHVVVEVRDPTAYLRRASWPMRLAVRANRRLVGSTITIASTGLKISSEDLHELLREGFEASLRP